MKAAEWPLGASGGGSNKPLVQTRQTMDLSKIQRYAKNRQKKRRQRWGFNSKSHVKFRNKTCAPQRRIFKLFLRIRAVGPQLWRAVRARARARALSTRGFLQNSHFCSITFKTIKVKVVQLLEFGNYAKARFNTSRFRKVMIKTILLRFIL